MVLFFKNSANEDDEVFFGPVGHRERCIAASLELNHQISQQPPLPASDGPCTLSPLPAEKFVEVYREARLLALQLESHSREEGVPAAGAGSSWSQGVEKFIQESKLKMKLFEKEEEMEKSPKSLKRETYYLSDSPFQGLPLSGEPLLPASSLALPSTPARVGPVLTQGLPSSSCPLPGEPGAVRPPDQGVPPKRVASKLQLPRASSVRGRPLPSALEKPKTERPASPSRVKLLNEKQPHRDVLLDKPSLALDAVSLPAHGSHLGQGKRSLPIPSKVGLKKTLLKPPGYTGSLTRKSSSSGSVSSRTSSVCASPAAGKGEQPAAHAQTYYTTILLRHSERSKVGPTAAISGCELRPPNKVQLAFQEWALGTFIVLIKQCDVPVSPLAPEAGELAGDPGSSSRPLSSTGKPARMALAMPCPSLPTAPTGASCRPARRANTAESMDGQPRAPSTAPLALPQTPRSGGPRLDSNSMSSSSQPNKIGSIRRQASCLNSKTKVMPTPSNQSERPKFSTGGSTDSRTPRSSQAQRLQSCISTDSFDFPCAFLPLASTATSDEILSSLPVGGGSSTHQRSRGGLAAAWGLAPVETMDLLCVGTLAHWIPVCRGRLCSGVFFVFTRAIAHSTPVRRSSGPTSQSLLSSRGTPTSARRVSALPTPGGWCPSGLPLMTPKTLPRALASPLCAPARRLSSEPQRRSAVAFSDKLAPGPAAPQHRTLLQKQSASRSSQVSEHSREIQPVFLCSHRTEPRGASSGRAGGRLAGLSPSGSPSPPPSMPQALQFSPEKNESPFSGDFTGAAQVEAKPGEDTCPGEALLIDIGLGQLTITPQVGSRPPADLPLIDFCSPPEADVALGSASRALIDLTTNTPDVNRNSVSKNSVSKPLQAEGQLIDLGSPLVQLSPEADKENVDSPLLKF
ncbi:G2 and S-phase expressed 1 [Ictidomys tridecemlineatus]|nr:G2 and S-phase expressed 1 [Ictidomys tridecemlineatus]